MNILAFSGVAIITAILSVMIKKTLPEYSVAINLAAGAILIFSFISAVSPAVFYIKSLIEKSGITSENEIILFKTLGICIITQFICDACKDAGENSIAAKVEMGGKFMVLLTAIPLFESIFKAAVNLMGNRI